MVRYLPTLSLKVADLFSSSCRYAVPAYQRPYSWSAREASQLLDDVLAASGIDAPDEAQSDYFLGAMVLLDPVASSDVDFASAGPRTVEIVDGQQRVVTLTILAAVLRDLEPDASSPLARRLHGLIAEPNGSDETAPVFRLTLGRAVGDLLMVHVQTSGSTRLTIDATEPLTPGQQAIRDVRDHLIRELSLLDDDQRRTLAVYLLDHCHVVAVLSGELDHAHRLFTVLNQRGKPLQRSDILKAEMLAQVERSDVARATELWEAAERLVGNEFESLLGHVRTIHGHTRPQIIVGVRSVVAASGGTLAFLEHELCPLALGHGTLTGIANGTVSLSPAIDRAVTYMSRLNGTEWLPAALLAVRLHGRDLSTLTALLSGVDRLAHNLRLLGLGTGKRVQRFAAVIAAMRRGTALDHNAEVFALRRGEARKVAHNLKDPHVRSPQLCKLLLLRIGDEIEGKLTRVNVSGLTVEHILPQRPPASSKWRSMFPDPRERENCTESLGNLVLIDQSQNERARNSDFEAKRQVFRGVQDLPPITRDALETRTWDAAIIKAREARLMGLLSEMLGLDLGAVPSRHLAAPAGEAAHLRNWPSTSLRAASDRSG